MSSGKIIQIIGAVIDVEFSRETVPSVYDALKVVDKNLTLEAVSYTHLTLPTILRV